MTFSSLEDYVSGNMVKSFVFTKIVICNIIIVMFSLMSHKALIKILFIIYMINLIGKQQ